MNQLHLGSSPQLDYVTELATAPPSYLDDLERASHRRVINGKMVSGRHQGRILSMISTLVRPQLILEVGTFTGYSALCLAEGLGEGGLLYTIEHNEELSAIQDEFWQRSPYADRIHRLCGDALEEIEKFDQRPDLVFLDADKSTYLDIFDLLKDRLPSGSLILADNVLWHGRVYDEQASDETTERIKEFNERVARDPDFMTVILPIRDGISLIRKK